MLGRHQLTLQLLLMGQQCPRRLYSTVYQPRDCHQTIADFYPALSPRAQSIVELGYPGGVNAILRAGELPAAWLGWTNELLQGDAPVIYNAAIAFDNILARIDVLKRENFGWKAVLVSENLTANQQQLASAMLVYLVEGSGLLLTAVSMVVINGDSSREEIRSVLAGARSRSRSVPELVDTCRSVLESVHQPAALPGPHCSQPHPCHLLDRCLANN